MPEYDSKTGKLITWVENPAESAVPKEPFRGLRAGRSLAGITRDLAAAGHMNRSGKPFGQQHLRVMARSVAALSGKIAELETQERELTMPAALAGILAPGMDVAQWWEDALVSARREVARIILSPGLLGEVRVKRAVRTGSGYNPAAERIGWHRTTT